MATIVAMGLDEQVDQRVGLQSLVDDAGRTAKRKGFWDGKGVDGRFPEAIALIHSELSEALEAHRQGEITGPDSVPVELADTCIRIFDLAYHFDEKHGTDFCVELIKKMAYNKTRQPKHGKRY